MTPHPRNRDKVPAPTQKQRVLNALRKFGRHGITQIDFLEPHVTDGGPPITRVGARIQDLRDAGYPITSEGTRDKCAIYVLAESHRRRPVAPIPPPPDPLVDDETGATRLFPPPVHRRHDQEAA